MMISKWPVLSMAVLACSLQAQVVDSIAPSPGSPAVSAPPVSPSETDNASAPPSTLVADPASATPLPSAAPTAPVPQASTPTAPATPKAQAAPTTPKVRTTTSPATPKPESKTAAEAPKSDDPQTAKGSKTDEASEGFAFQPGASFGVVTMNGQTWTRLSFTPEVSFGKLGVGFNIELFLDQNQNLSTRGWDFDTRRNGTESVLRKIDYVRWDHPGATFYARLGTLEGISLGYGLVAASYGNKARYPDYKELGADIQLNDMTGLGVDLEGIVGNLEDLQNNGPFTAFKAGFRPFKPLGMPLFKDLAFRAGAAYDWNQYAGLRDADADGCPDAIDKAPNDASTCVVPIIAIANLPYIPASVYASADSAQRDSSNTLKKNYSVRKPFGVYWLEAALPIVTTEFFGLELHSAIAKPETVDPAAVDAGWGAIPIGAGSHIGPVTLTAEYRLFSLPFQPDYFNSLYSIDRAKFDGQKVVTKEMDIYGPDAQTGTMQGYFAGAGWDVFGFLKLSGDYSHMFPSKSSDDELRALRGSIGIGPQVTDLLQQKVSLAELYWRKDRIELDKHSVNGVERRDSFFGNSSYTVFGYRIGSLVAPGLTMVVDRQTSFTRREDGSLKRDNQMRIEAQMKF